MGLSRTPDPRGRPAIHHGGGIFGFVSDTRYYPEADLYVVVLVNTTGNLNPASIATELVDVLLPAVEVARMAGSQLVVFERDGDTGPATIVRLDSGGGHYVLRRKPGS